MSKIIYRQNKSKNFWALIGFLIIVMVVAGPILSVFASQGLFKGIWLEVLEAIPFGNVIGELSVKIFAKFISTGSDLNEYLTGLKKIRGLGEYIQEFCKLGLTSVVYSALNNWGLELMEIKSADKGWLFARKIVWSMFSAFISALVAGWVLELAFGQINRLTAGAVGIWGGVIATLILTGGVGVVACVLGIGAGLAIGYVLVKLLLLNVCSLVVSSTFLSLFILCISEKAYAKLAVSMSGWLVIVIMLAGVDMMLSSVFKT